MQLNGYFKAGQLKIGGGWLGRFVDTQSPAVADVRTNTFYLTGTYFVTPYVVLDGGVYRTLDKQQDTRATLAALRGTYVLSKRTNVYLQSGYLFNSAGARYTLSEGRSGHDAGRRRRATRRHGRHQARVLSTHRSPLRRSRIERDRERSPGPSTLFIPTRPAANARRPAWHGHLKQLDPETEKCTVNRESSLPRCRTFARCADIVGVQR